MSRKKAKGSLSPLTNTDLTQKAVLINLVYTGESRLHFSWVLLIEEQVIHSQVYIFLSAAVPSTFSI